MREGRRDFLWLSAFALAMGLLEAVVVVYLRELYYPTGFRFPLSWIPERTLLIETLREACTLLMIVSVSALSARGFVMRLSHFLFIFGLWDISYYAGLKALLGWPPSLMTWDVLFLIPVAWLGPVLAPLICALTMILMSLLLARLYDSCGFVRAGAARAGLIIFGAIAILASFIRDSVLMIVRGGFLLGPADLSGLLRDPAFREALLNFVPTDFAWGVFAIGEGAILLSLALIWLATKKALGKRCSTASG